MSQSATYDLIMLALLAAAVLIGARVGILRAASGLVGMVLASWAAHRFVPVVQPAVAGLISPIVKSAVRSAAKKAGAVPALSSVPPSATVSPTLPAELSDIFDRLSESLKISPELGEGIMQKARQAGESMGDAISDAITNMLAPMLSFALIFIAVQVAVTLLCGLLGTRGIPVVSTVNSIGGALLGAVYGIVAIAVISWGVLVFAPPEPQGLFCQPVARQSITGSIVSAIVD